MTIGQLVIDLLFHADTKTLRSFTHDLGDLNLASVFAATGLTGLYEGLKNIMSIADHTAMQFNNLSGITGVAARTFQEWDNAATKFGVTAGATSSAIAGIQSNIFELIKTGSGPGQMIGMLLGIDPRGFLNHPEELLRKELEYLKQFDPVTRRFYAQMLGLNEEELLLVDHLDEINHVLANQRQEFQELAIWHKIVINLANDLRVIFVSLGAILAPIFQPFISILTIVVTLFSELIQKVPILVQLMLILGAAFALLGGIVLNPTLLAILGGIGLAGFAADKSGLTDLITHPNNANSQFDNSRSVDVNNTYHINGGNPQDVQKAIDNHWQKVTRESDLMGYQTNY